MTSEIRQKLIEKFSLPEGKVVMQRERRIWLEVPEEKFKSVFEYAYKDLKCIVLNTITGLDSGENLEFIYHLSTMSGIMVNIKRFAPKSKPVITTINEYFPGGVIYERELVDLLGAVVEGMPEGERYPMPDDFPKNEYPLRKDWKPKGVQIDIPEEGGNE